MPDEIGMYLALTGRSIGRADAYRLGLVTHCIPAARFAEIHAGLRVADPVDPLLDDRHVDPGPAELDALRPVIARCFSADTVEGIVARLRAERGDGAPWARGRARGSGQAVADLAQDRASARALAARRRSARDAGAGLTASPAAACEAHDFYEGVRAALIDRDRSPKWQPARLEDVTPAMLDAYFAPLGAGDLALASRAEMQAVAAVRPWRNAATAVVNPLI